ncbi:MULTISPECIES: hemolysin III family protein [unclassified Devosia]|uniref:PAQR family membrane homeostasis protein TrhA n=1 Tax=unclassified Devosia TaxID=196773 RepID=UPI00145EEF43|nr:MULTISPECIES: hemolysin III family protein [unclassified Devosia]MBJ6986876.1 hemolysin III family protein [Devosia sp. MC521]QMW63906.1 hemolysin III family protein [Devosia sp. MC521]
MKQTSYSTNAMQFDPRRRYSVGEMVADAVVHVLGLIVAIAAGSALLTLTAFETAPEAVPALSIYVGTLIFVLGVSLAYNLWPHNSWKHVWARLDQAAIFLFIAGSYTPFLAVLGNSTLGITMMAIVWGASLVGVALKLIVPERFGRVAIPLYLGIGWSGIFVFNALATALPPTTLWLLLAGGVAYSAGIIFHVWEKLRFQNALWHVFVVAGASLHLWAVIDCMIVARM